MYVCVCVCEWVWVGVCVGTLQLTPPDAGSLELSGNFLLCTRRPFPHAIPRRGCAREGDYGQELWACLMDHGGSVLVELTHGTRASPRPRWGRDGFVWRLFCCVFLGLFSSSSSSLFPLLHSSSKCLILLPQPLSGTGQTATSAHLRITKLSKGGRLR